MLKTNKRLDKLAAARADFTARGMLMDSCLIHAIRSAVDYNSEDTMDEDTSDSDETDDDTDEIFVFNPNRPSGIQDFDTDTSSGIPDDANDEQDPENLNDEQDPNVDVSRPHTPD